MTRGSSFTARLFTAVLVFLGLSLAANLVGCGGSSTPPPTGITIQGPTNGTIDPGDSASFTATVTNDSHNAGVTWTLAGTGCTGAACGALSNSTTTGVTYTAPATVTTAFTVTITVTSVADSRVTTTIMLSVPVNPSITTAAGTLPGGVIGTPYSVTLAGAGGITPYTWSITQGMLPAGLALNASTGVISGTPSAAGSTSFTVVLTDSGSPALTATAQFTIAIAYPAPTINTSMLANGTVGTPYSGMITASGGSGGGYSFAVTSGTGLSAVGLSLAPRGAVSGTPNAAETAGTFVVTVTDSAGGTASATISLTVVYSAITITPATLPNGTAGTAYAQSLVASGGSGTGYSYAVTSGTGLSAVGLNLSSTGSITGTPNAGETAGTFVVTATDSKGNQGTGTITLTIVYSAITITPGTLQSGGVGSAYLQSLAASGGSGTGYSFAVTSGTGLSAVGLSLSSSGSITGTPNAGETAGTFVVTVTDSKGNTGMATITLTVFSSLTVITTTLPNDIVGTAYSQTLNAVGGSGTGYTWSVTTGTSSLSAVGLNLSSGGVLSGNTPVAGTATFTVQVTDSVNNKATANLSVTIFPSLVVSTTSLANGTEGTAYTATLAATGGSGTGYTWTVTSGTGLSGVGLSLSTSGAITGVPNKGESVVPVTVQVTDSNGDKATGTLTLTVAAVVFQGQVLSGQLPVAGATIQLYTVGSTGNGSAATPMLTQTVTTDGIGFFNLAGFYTCGQNSSGSSIAGTSNQVYLVATGGSTSLTSTSGNGALVMVTAVGSCSNLASTPFFTINELTTAAAAWALAPFSASAANIGGSATNVLGITNAFLDAALLANPAAGSPATLPTGLTVETGKLAAFADVLNTCTASADGTGCSTLFAAATPANGTAPVNSFNAALNIVQNPGQNVAAVYAVIPTTGTPPFATTLTASPNDWTMSLTVTGGGLSTPTALGIDSLNNIWVADEDGPLSAFNAQGTTLSSTGFGIVSGVPIIGNSFGLAIDTSNNIWVTNQQTAAVSNGSITEFYGVNNPTTFPTGTSPQPLGYVTNVYFPVSIAADTIGNIYVANTGQFTSVTIYNGSGNVVAPALADFVAISAGQNSVAIDTATTNTGFWLSDNAGEVEHFSSSGALLVNAACCEDSLGIATDSAGDVWIADYLGGADGHGAIAEAVTDSSGNTSVPITNLTTGGINYPQAVVVDAAQNVWFANKINGSITELAGINNALSVTTAISPSTGVYGTGGYGLDGNLDEPYSLLPDRSGNLWVSNEGGDSVTMFFGLAAPTVTPLQPVPTAP